MHLFGYEIIVYFGYINVFLAQNHLPSWQGKMHKLFNAYFNGFSVILI